MWQTCKQVQVKNNSCEFSLDCLIYEHDERDLCFKCGTEMDIMKENGDTVTSCSRMAREAKKYRLLKTIHEGEA